MAAFNNYAEPHTDAGVLVHARTPILLTAVPPLGSTSDLEMQASLKKVRKAVGLLDAEIPLAYLTFPLATRSWGT